MRRVAIGMAVVGLLVISQASKKKTEHSAEHGRLYGAIDGLKQYSEMTPESLEIFKSIQTICTDLDTLSMSNKHSQQDWVQSKKLATTSEDYIKLIILEAVKSGHVYRNIADDFASLQKAIENTAKNIQLNAK